MTRLYRRGSHTSLFPKSVLWLATAARTADRSLAGLLKAVEQMPAPRANSAHQLRAFCACSIGRPNLREGALATRPATNQPNPHRQNPRPAVQCNRVSATPPPPSASLARQNDQFAHHRWFVRATLDGEHSGLVGLEVDFCYLPALKHK